MNEEWKKLLEESRNNYLAIVQSISKMQKEIEKTFISNAESSFNHQQEELTAILNNWVKMGTAMKENLQSVFETNLKNTFDSFSVNLPFKDEMNKLYSNIQDSFKKYFENLENFNFLMKKK